MPNMNSNLERALINNGWNNGIDIEKKKKVGRIFLSQEAFLTRHTLKIEGISHENRPIRHTNNKVKFDMFSTHCVINGSIEYRLDFSGF